MASVINAVSGSGITQTADGSGVLKIQSNSVTTNALAWVNFNGTGTVAIRASYNVSSITDNGTGDYTVNFATALADAKYAIACNGSNLGGVSSQACFPNDNATARSTAVCRVATAGLGGGALVDCAQVSVSIFGN